MQIKNDRASLILFILLVVLVITFFLLHSFHVFLHHLILLLILLSVSALAKHNNFVLRFCVFPSSKNKQVRPNRSACVAEACSRRESKIFAALPAHGIGRPDHKVIALFGGWIVLESGAGSLCPASKHYNIRA